MLSKSLQIIGSLRFMPSLKQKTGGNMGHFCFLLTSDFRVEEEKLADKILCLFGEKQIESTLKKTLGKTKIRQSQSSSCNSIFSLKKEVLIRSKTFTVSMARL